LTHEHFSLNFDKFYCEPPESLSEFFTDGVNQKIHLKNAGFIRQYPYGSKFNINFEDDETHRAVIEDLKIFKRFGGGAIVENTTCGINRNLKLMYKAAKELGLNIIAGTGHYLGMTQSQETLKMSVEEMVKLYMDEMENGIDVQISANESVKIKCGVVGEIGSAYPINEFEKRSILAAAEVQNNLKCGVTFHPGRDSPNSPFEIMRIYLEAGGDASKCVMSHLDRMFLCDFHTTFKSFCFQEQSSTTTSF
jgi:phosphotriesterase-related protein